MTSGFTNQQLVDDFRNKSVPVLEQAVDYIKSEQKKDIENVLNQVLETSKEKSLKEGIARLSELTETPKKDLNGIWIDAIEEAGQQLPELVVLPQDESHFRYEEGDTSQMAIGTFLKRMNRGVQSLGLSTANGIRRLAKKPEKELDKATRNVLMKDISRWILYKDFLPVISEWHEAQARFVSKVFKEVQDWFLEELLTTEDHPELEDLIDEELKKYDQIRKEYADKIKKQIDEVVILNIEQSVKKAGTLKLNESRFEEDSLMKQKEEFTIKLEKNHSLWVDLLNAQYEQLEVTQQLSDLKSSLVQKSETLVSESEHFFLRCAVEPHKTFETKIIDSVSEFKKLSNISHSELEKYCDDIQEYSSQLLENEIVKPLQSAIEENYLSRLLETYVSEVADLSNSQPEKYKLIEDLDISGAIPKYSVNEVEWQQFIQRNLSKYIAGEMLPTVIEPEDLISNLISDYQEIDQIVETNLDIVEEVTGKEDEAPIDIALQGLERTLNKLEETREYLQNSRSVFSEKVQETNSAMFKHLNDLLKKQDGSEMRWAGTQLKVTESAGGWKTKWTVLWARFTDRMTLFYRFFLKKYRQYLDNVKEQLGLKKDDQLIEQKTDLATFLHETDQKIELLPFIYRRLFDFRRDVEATFFIKDPVHFDQVKKSFDLWKGGFPSCLSVIGEKGSGKSTTIRFLNEQLFADENTYNLPFNSTIWKEEEMISFIANNLNLKEITGREELIQAIKKKKKGCVVSIENIQNCYIRNISGYAAIKSLLHVITETKREIFWIVSASRYAWNFLEVVFNIGDYFSHSLQADLLDTVEVQTLIMKRQKASGYQLRFLPDAITEKTRSYRKLLDDDTESQSYLRDRYFEKLSKMAEGNATVAMIFWIRSIKEISETGFTIESFDFTATERLDGLDATSLFALSAFVLHDSLNPTELALILNNSEEDCELIISRLNSRGLLVQKKSYYFLNDLIYRQVVRLLKTRNILH